MTSLFDDLLTEEQILFRDSVRGFAERHLADGRLARAHERSFPFDVARLMAGQGLLGMTFPEEDRKSVVSGKSVSVRGDLGGARIINKQTDRLDIIHMSEM